MFKEIHPPTHCPACDSPLLYEKDELYCKNDDCGAQSSKKLEHFCKTLKIKGFGPATLEKMGLESVLELYSIPDSTTLKEALGCSDKVADKLWNELEFSKQSDLASVLAAFSISLIGNSKSKDLAAVVGHIEDIDENACAKAGLGPKATESILTWLDNFYYAGGYSELPFSFTSTTTVKEGTKDVVCISGKLTSVKTKADAKKELEAAGYEVKPSLTKDVTILLNESGIESSKTEKARKNNIKIVTQLKDLLGGI